MSAQLQRNLKLAEADVRAYVKHLESENRKLQAKVFKLESQYAADQHRIAALKKELKEAHITVYVNRDGKKTTVGTY